jgi:hypothetical protein
MKSIKQWEQSVTFIVQVRNIHVLLTLSLYMAVIRGNLSDSNPASAGNLGFFPLCNSVELISYSTLEVPTYSFRSDLVFSENICQHATEFFVFKY